MSEPHTTGASPWASASGETLAEALADAGGGEDIESVTRPLLAALGEITGLGTTFLTSIDWEQGVQTVEFAAGSRGMTPPESAAIPWEQTLCRRAMEDCIVSTNAVQSLWADNALAAAMALQTYVSSPVTLPDGQVFGTLCGASIESLPVGDHTTNLLRTFSNIIAAAVTRDRELHLHRVRAESAEERLRERAMFLAMSEHKLKTSLTVLTGWSSLLVNGLLPSERRDEAAQAVADAAGRLSTDISEMLAEATAHVLESELETSEMELDPSWSNSLPTSTRCRVSTPCERRYLTQRVCVLMPGRCGSSWNTSSRTR